MQVIIIFLAALAVLILPIMAIKVVRQWERGVVLRFGRLIGIRKPGFRVIFPFVDRMKGQVPSYLSP